MAYSFNHVHLKAKDPSKSAQWYVDMFGAKPLGERDVGGALFVTVQVGGVTINISSPRPSEA
ncbi:MAG: VOC family protein, partial [Dehalococcoidia bacterium]